MGTHLAWIGAYAGMPEGPSDGEISMVFELFDELGYADQVLFLVDRSWGRSDGGVWKAEREPGGVMTVVPCDRSLAKGRVACLGYDPAVGGGIGAEAQRAVLAAVEMGARTVVMPFGTGIGMTGLSVSASLADHAGALERDCERDAAMDPSDRDLRRAAMREGAEMASTVRRARAGGPGGSL